MLLRHEAEELESLGLKVTPLTYAVNDNSESLYSVYGNHNVGYFRLRSGRLVTIAPKVPIANVFSLLAVAYKFYLTSPPFLDQTVPYSSTSDRPLQALVEHFSSLVDDLLRDGLLRRYVEQEENRTTVRGQLIFKQQLLQNLIRRDRLFCRFAVSDVDLAENRIILWTLLTLHRSTRWAEQLRRKLQAQIMHFGGVTAVPFPAGQVPKFVYDRLSERYSNIHAWCRFFIDQMTLLNSSGSVVFYGFRLNMFELFERFVFSVFEHSSRKYLGVRVEKTRFPLDRDRRLGINPDIVVRSRSETVVVDAKYKVTNDGVGRHPDVYQLVAYSTVLGLVGSSNRPQAFLVYPASERTTALEGDLHVLTSTTGETGLTVRTLWFDLAADNVVANAIAVADSALTARLHSASAPSRT
jgi:5-methylcytosine-specific restriction endonuclease McrBC regulatory subunit McrC